jgi:omega-6 fatty acid desaturase (delta-12 desaturase)
MYLTIHWKVPCFVTFLLAIPASAFMVRLFIFFHDCSHGSCLASPRATKILGSYLGILVSMPFFEWRSLHAGHHSTSGNLDRRGIGDVWTMTVREYKQSSGFRRLLYRISRHPAVMFGLGSLYVLLIAHRLTSRGARKDAVLSVIFTDLMLAAILSVAVHTIGIKACLTIELPIIFMAGAAGVWLFYIQHQFDPSYWARNEQWDSTEAALQGSSFYKSPKLLQWFSANIGFHHIHYLRPRIPNYNLKKCLKETPELQLECPLTLWRSLKSVRLNLWDEGARTLVSFREAVRAHRAGQ